MTADRETWATTGGDRPLRVRPANHRCPRPGCDGLVVVARIMRWCQRCKWTGLA